VANTTISQDQKEIITLKARLAHLSTPWKQINKYNSKKTREGPSQKTDIKNANNNPQTTRKTKGNIKHGVATNHYHMNPNLKL
jgi:hypothetical protein